MSAKYLLSVNHVQTLFWVLGIHWEVKYSSPPTVYRLGDCIDQVGVGTWPASSVWANNAQLVRLGEIY